MITKEQEKLLQTFIENMMPGSQITLEELNKINGMEVFKLYQVYEEVHNILQRNFRNFRFTKSKDLKKSIIYRVNER
jgi:hypothetical protein